MTNKIKNRRKFKEIIKELGARDISLEDIAKNRKNLGIMDVLKETGGTMDDYAMLSMYSEAIVNGSVKAAEFIRDTAGEKPQSDININSKRSILEDMSLEDLEALRNDLKTKTDENKEN